MEEQFDKEIHALAQQIKGLYDQAVAVYTHLVDDICSRVAPMKEVEWLVRFCRRRTHAIVIQKSLPPLLASISGNDRMAYYGVSKGI